MQVITFASTNLNKYREVQSILSIHGIAVDFAEINPIEIQSDSLEEISGEKAKSAFAMVEKPVIVEDDGLFIDALKGFPGQYSSHTFKTIGNEGILKLLLGTADRMASFRSLIAFYDGERLSMSEGCVNGIISDTVAGLGWGYDPIFIPAGTNLTFAQLKDRKNEYSHRKKALDRFASWYAIKS